MDIRSTIVMSLLLLLDLLVHNVFGEDVLITITKEKIDSGERESALIEAILTQHSPDTISSVMDLAVNPDSTGSDAPDVIQRLDRTNRKHKRRHQRTDGKRNESVGKSCCFHGGLCVLGSFCHCRKNFYGRHCEHDRREQHCGEVQHDQIVRQGCDLCHCLHGQLSCLPRIFHGCDDEPAEVHSTDVHTEGEQQGNHGEERAIIDQEIRKVMSEYSSESNGASHLNLLKDVNLLIGCLLLSLFRISDSVR